MPFKSEKQRRYLFLKHPDIAKRWAHEYPESNKNLPMYVNNAHEKHKSTEDTEMSGKEAQITLAKAVLKPILARFAPPRELIQKKSNSILAPVQVPQTGRPTYAQENANEDAGTGPNPVNNDKDNIGNNAAEQNGENSTLENILCAKYTEKPDLQELHKIAQILRKKAMVPAYNIRKFLEPIMAGIQQGTEAPHVQRSVRGNGVGGHVNGNGVAAGLGGSGLGGGGIGTGAEINQNGRGMNQNGQGMNQNGQGMNQNGQGMNQNGGNLAPAPPKGSFLPRLVGKGYLSFLNAAVPSLAQNRANPMIPPPLGSQPRPSAPNIVASFPGMNSAPTKTASNTSGSSLNTGLKAIQPVSPHFQASNLANKNKSPFATGSDALLNTIGKLSPFKTVGGKIDITAGLSGGAYGNLPNTPKTQALG